MLSFHSPKFLIFFISICIIQSVFSQEDQEGGGTGRYGSSGFPVKCKVQYQYQKPRVTTVCVNELQRRHQCISNTCGNTGTLYSEFKGCLHNGVAGSGASVQRCSEYKDLGKGMYECTNSGGQTYHCPYKTSAAPFITCGDCQYIGTGIGTP